jgi:hypothetical protein
MLISDEATTQGRQPGSCIPHHLTVCPLSQERRAYSSSNPELVSFSYLQGKETELE